MINNLCPIPTARWANYGEPGIWSSDWATAQDVSYITHEAPKSGVSEGRSMQRPVMDPTFMYDDAPGGKKKPRQRFAWVWRILRAFRSILFFSPFGNKHFRNEDGSRI